MKISRAVTPERPLDVTRLNWEGFLRTVAWSKPDPDTRHLDLVPFTGVEALRIANWVSDVSRKLNAIGINTEQELIDSLSTVNERLTEQGYLRFHRSTLNTIQLLGFGSNSNFLPPVRAAYCTGCNEMGHVLPLCPYVENPPKTFQWDSYPGIAPYRVGSSMQAIFRLMHSVAVTRGLERFQYDVWAHKVLSHLRRHKIENLLEARNLIWADKDSWDHPSRLPSDNLAPPFVITPNLDLMASRRQFLHRAWQVDVERGNWTCDAENEAWNIMYPNHIPPHESNWDDYRAARLHAITSGATARVLDAVFCFAVGYQEGHGCPCFNTTEQECDTGRLAAMKLDVAMGNLRRLEFIRDHYRPNSITFGPAPPEYPDFDDVRILNTDPFWRETPQSGSTRNRLRIPYPDSLPPRKKGEFVSCLSGDGSEGWGIVCIERGRTWVRQLGVRRMSPLIRDNGPFTADGLKEAQDKVLDASERLALLVRRQEGKIKEGFLRFEATVGHEAAAPWAKLAGFGQMETDDGPVLASNRMNPDEPIPPPSTSVNVNEARASRVRRRELSDELHQKADRFHPEDAEPTRRNNACAQHLFA